MYLGWILEFWWAIILGGICLVLLYISVTSDRMSIFSFQWWKEMWFIPLFMGIILFVGIMSYTTRTTEGGWQDLKTRVLDKKTETYQVEKTDSEGDSYTVNETYYYFMGSDEKWYEYTGVFKGRNWKKLQKDERYHCKMRQLRKGAKKHASSPRTLGAPVKKCAQIIEDQT